MLSEDELRALQYLSDSDKYPIWKAMVEGRDHESGDSFILVSDDADFGTDVYLNHDHYPAPPADLDLIAAARTYLPLLLRDIEELRRRLDELIHGRL